jgi:SAM-dependent methyltransferase
MSGELPFSAAAERNKDPLLAVLKEVLPPDASVLEIASGTGQHVCHFAQALPATRWQPSEPDASNRQAIARRVQACGAGNVAAPLALDVTDADWGLSARYDAVLCINMVHISPWAATLALLEGAARHLSPGGRLVLYGPYLEGGTAVTSNLEFDASLKRRNPQWGLRDVEEVTRRAADQGFERRRLVRMPANNLTLVFTRA